jgi:DsbC/DsbD-like thiol-disulfide interchange protein
MTLRSNSPRSACLLFLALALSPPFAAVVSAQSPAEIHAKVQLVSEEKSIRSSGPFSVGILFQLDPGWHIYWQNPGDSGEPPKIEWRLPPDFRASAIRWPRPILLGKGSVRDYGYEGQVLLMTTLQRHHPVATSVAIAATIKYIVCREVCIPGKADAKLLLPVSEATNIETTGWSELFKSTRAQLPKPLPPEWNVSVVSTTSNFVLTFRGGAAQEMRFFPFQPNVIENAAPQTFDSDKNGLRLTLKKSEQLAKPISTLRGVIVLDRDRTYEIAVPVKSS